MKKFSLFLLLVVLATACVPRKRLTYLQEENETVYQLQRSSYRIQPNDILSILIRSLDQETTMLFNISQMAGGGAGGGAMMGGGDMFFYLQGYPVDLQGRVNVPVLGQIQVNGMTIEEIQVIVEERLNEYFVEDAVNVTVQLAGIRYSVVGDVARPGKYVIFQNQVNIFEALAQAGDITMVGDRKQVMIVRQLPDGVHTYSLDLTDSEIINSPLFFIQPNDIINIKPLPQKSFGTGTTGFQTFSSLIGVLASTITLIIAINSFN